MNKKLQLICNEIERLRNEGTSNKQIAINDNDQASYIAWEQQEAVMNLLLSFIDSISHGLSYANSSNNGNNLQESASDGLEEAANNYVESIEHVLIPTDGIGWRRAYKENDTIATFKAGANWQKRKDLQSEDIDIDNIDDVDLENLEYPKDYAKGYTDGFKNAKRQMVKDAVEAECLMLPPPDLFKVLLCYKITDRLAKNDKVKVIIIKEDKQ